MSSQTLGVHILTYNEEQFLDNCMKSVKTIADEIVVIDTGSSDATLQIAQSFGAKVISTVWEDNFSQPRNIGLNYATTDWILVLDADEYLVSSKTQLSEMLEHFDVEAYSVLIENLLDDTDEQRIFHSSLRLFRNRPYYRFEGRIHEQIGPSILTENPLSTLHDSSLKIIHRGYIPMIIQQKQKTERNFRILNEALREHPDDPFYMYHLGITYSQQGEMERATDCLLKSLNATPKSATYRSTLVRDTATTLLQSGKTLESEKILRQEIENSYHDFPDLHFLLGQSLEIQGHLLKAYQTYEKATQCQPIPGKYGTIAGTNTFRAFTKMGELAIRMNDPNNSFVAFKQALHSHPRFEPAILGIAEALHMAGVSDSEVTAHLHQLCARQTTDQLLLLFKSLFSIGAYLQALDFLKDVHDFPIEVYATAYECQLYNHEFGKARELIEKVISSRLRQGIEMFNQTDSVMIDYAICWWTENKSLPHTFYRTIPQSLMSYFLTVDMWLHSEYDSVLYDSEPFHEWSQEVVRRMVHLGQLQMADTVSSHFPRYVAQTPIIFYEYGYSVLAANRLLDFMKERDLSSEELCIVGEVLMDKGHYDQALGLFEEAIVRQSDYSRARLDAAKCYMLLAQKTLQEGLTRYPNHPSLSEDANRIQANLFHLDTMSERPRWSTRQRRNNGVTTVDFAMHDCQK